MDPEVSKLKFTRDVEAVRAVAGDFGWTVARADFPVLDVVVKHPKSGRAFGFRFLCDGWDLVPPSFFVHDPETWEPLPWERWPQGSPFGQSHTTTHKPFLCLPGIREYHTHESHLSDHWEPFRAAGKHKLVDIVLRVKQRFGDGNG